MKGRNVAILGATGLVGSTVLQVLDERRFPVGNLRLLASRDSAGQQVSAFGATHTIADAATETFEGVDVCFSAVDTVTVRAAAPRAVRMGAVVIDKSNAYRLAPEVPLVVPEVNPGALAGHAGIIASPNCSTIQLVVALEPIRRLYGLRRVVVSSYQSVSGTGRAAMAELRSQTALTLAGCPAEAKVYPVPMALNIYPLIDQLDGDGHTGEEWKLVRETRRILDLPDLPVTATCVRVPVLVGHSEAVLVETESPADLDELAEAFRASPSVQFVDRDSTGMLLTPAAVAGTDWVRVCRLRRDLTSPTGLWLWVVSDNLRKGAATNAVQIAECLIRQNRL